MLFIFRTVQFGLVDARVYLLVGNRPAVPTLEITDGLREYSVIRFVLYSSFCSVPVVVGVK